MLAISLMTILEELAAESGQKNFTGDIKDTAQLLDPQSLDRLAQIALVTAFLAFHPGTDRPVVDYVRNGALSADSGPNVLVLFALDVPASAPVPIGADAFAGWINFDAGSHPSYDLVRLLFDGGAVPTLPGIVFFRTAGPDADAVYVELNGLAAVADVQARLREVLSLADEAGRDPEADGFGARVADPRLPDGGRPVGRHRQPRRPGLTMIAADEGIHPVIAQLGALLLRELELVGTFAYTARIDDPAPLLGHLYDRGFAIVQILAVLDAGADLRLDGEPVPYALDRATALPDVALAGYAGPGGAAIPPGRLAASLLQRWSEVLTAEEPGDTELFRLFRAAAWIAHTDGIPAGIDYLLALVSRGHVLDPRVAGEAAGILVIAAASDPTPDEFRAAMWADSPEYEGDWWAAFAPADWMVPVLPGAPVAPLVMRVLEAGFAARREALAAPDLDTWLTCLHRMSRLVAVALTAVATALAEPSVSVRAVLAQLEELRADVAAA